MEMHLPACEIQTMAIDQATQLEDFNSSCRETRHFFGSFRNRKTGGLEHTSLHRLEVRPRVPHHENRVLWTDSGGVLVAKRGNICKINV